MSGSECQKQKAKRSRYIDITIDLKIWVDLVCQSGHKRFEVRDILWLHHIYGGSHNRSLAQLFYSLIGTGDLELFVDRQKIKIKKSDRLESESQKN